MGQSVHDGVTTFMTSWTHCSTFQRQPRNLDFLWFVSIIKISISRNATRGDFEQILFMRHYYIFTRINQKLHFLSKMDKISHFLASKVAQSPTFGSRMDKMSHFLASKVAQSSTLANSLFVERTSIHTLRCKK